MKYSLFLVYDYECEFRYLGATTNYKKLKEGNYRGSGTLWKKHLKECSHSHSTIIILHTTDNHEEHKEKAKYYSKKYNIVENYWFLNLQEEHGVPELLEDDELNQFCKKIGRREYDKLVKNQLDCDINIETTSNVDIWDKCEKVNWKNYSCNKTVNLSKIKNIILWEQTQLNLLEFLILKLPIEKKYEIKMKKVWDNPNWVNRKIVKIKTYKEKEYLEREDALEVVATAYLIVSAYSDYDTLEDFYLDIERQPYNKYIPKNIINKPSHVRNKIDTILREFRKYSLNKENPLAEKNIS